MEERRKAIRVKTNLSAQYSLDDAAGNRIWDISQVYNISELGVSILISKIVKTGSLISLRFRIPFRPLENIEITGKVVHCAPSNQKSVYLVRIKFKYLDENTVIIFREYVDWIIKNQKA